MKLLAFDPKKRKQVLCGEIEGDTFLRTVEPKHFMRIVQGYGIQEVAFQELVLRKIKKTKLIEAGTNKTWEAPTEKWLENGKVMDFGYGKQRFLSLKFMKGGGL